MSPEQCRGAGTVDARADIYSLGVMLFEMLAGRPPFMAEGVGELFTMHMFQPAPSLADYVPNVPRHMAAAVKKALAKEPGDRLQSMDEFRDALSGELELDLEEPDRPSTASPPVSLRAVGLDDQSPTPRRRWLVPAVVATFAITAAIGFQLMPRLPSAAAPQVATPAYPLVAQATTTPPMAPKTPPLPVHDQSRALPGVAALSLPNIARTPPVRHRAKKVERVVDEDGLATPSF
jgi:serine/threonine-protein kinase